MAKKLASKAVEAFKFLQNTALSYPIRVQALNGYGEYGYAILNIWNRIEATLKLLHYYDDIKEKYPEKLNTKWGFLKKLNNDALDIIFSKNKNCLWKVRNKIVHQNAIITKEQYKHYHPNAVIILDELTAILQPKQKFQEKLNRTRN
ncbi:hypothetical protein [Bacteroides caecimuris]|nr:hypothetical protein [Bacteroides caecimuris]